ncbi:FAD-binding oxidoreductase [Pseudonocardia sp. GCM10023141]|uniref:FAD-binding oxidoreductase n=1 Tax=Pseudonocardia sp. GCM10023141 TaxID=3252653 RepID=UPI003609AD43
MSELASTTTRLAPTDLRSVRDAVLDTSGRIAIAGAGTAADWAGRLGAVDAVLDTTGLTGVIVHNPGDMTAAVNAGMPLRALCDELSSHGQYVALDAARVGDGATVGGLLATADAGPGALVHGSLRDLVIGATLVLPDGTVARTGGHVIKNVAGYDLTKVVHGSYGTLAVIAEVVLRLHPLPRGSVTIVLPCSLAEAAEHAVRVLAQPLEPAALEWVGESDVDGELLVRLEGSAGALEQRAERVSRLLGSSERHDGAPGVDESAVRSGADAFARHVELTGGATGAAVLRVGARPSRLPALLASLPGVVSITAGLGTGVATVALAPGSVADAHALVHAAGGTSVVRARPAGADVPAWGPPPSALGVLKAVKTALDPQDRFGSGRFREWM